MRTEVIPLKQPDPLAEVGAGLTLLKKLNSAGGHNQQTFALVLEKMGDDLAKHREQKRR